MNRFILADNSSFNLIFQFFQLLRVTLSQFSDWNTCPAGYDISDHTFIKA